MREQKRCFVGGHVTKYRKAGIFAKGPKFWAEQHRQNQTGFHSPETQARLGRVGGAKRSEAKTAACRANGRRGPRALWADPVFVEKMRWNHTRYTARTI